MKGRGKRREMEGIERDKKIRKKRGGMKERNERIINKKWSKEKRKNFYKSALCLWLVSSASEVMTV
jgi:ribonucleotide reductase alpha subunit